MLDLQLLPYNLAESEGTQPEAPEASYPAVREPSAVFKSLVKTVDSLKTIPDDNKSSILRFSPVGLFNNLQAFSCVYG